MSRQTAIAPDIRTLPRLRPGGRPNLIGLTRDGLRAALIAAGTPERQAN
ncbi:MAG: 23S rRNA (adenine(2503)-C(2))-methyltransferase RlmN, partial [Rhodobacteraceae bacterium]|nr:23S rRNA (adenine(2503)-C(2))-methyltransferase RlmN [Paracoccaceae bacterium]